MMRIKHRTTSNPLYETRRDRVSPWIPEAKELDNPIAWRVYMLQEQDQSEAEARGGRERREARGERRDLLGMSSVLN